jgi:hypothetical protein
MGIGYSMIVGNDTIILQQITKEYNKSEANLIQAKTNSYMFLALLLSGLIGVIIFPYNSSMIFICSIVATLFSIGSIYLMSYKFIVTKNLKINNVSQIDKEARNYYYVVRGFVLAIFVGVLPYFLFVINKSSIIWAGIVLSSFTFCGYISSRYLTQYIIQYNINNIFRISILCILISVLSLLFNNHYLGMPIALILGIVSGCVRPVTIAKINNNDYSVEATLNSAEYMYGILNTTILIMAAIVLKFFNFSFYVNSLVILILIFIVIHFYAQGVKYSAT